MTVILSYIKGARLRACFFTYIILNLSISELAVKMWRNSGSPKAVV